jgi:L-alanine-DL-glutamate epimerase-like enolase superfamily enzyme
MRTLQARRISWEMIEPFAISRGTISHADGVLVELTDERGYIGRGEAYGINYENETPEGLLEQIETVRAQVSIGADRTDLLSLLPHGGARCALDAAMWDLEAKQTDLPVWRLAGLTAFGKLTTAYTIGIRSPEQLAATLLRCRHYPVLKVKVDSRRPMDVLNTVRQLAPEAELIVDPNQSWTMQDLRTYAPMCRDLGVVLLEQPLSIDDDAGLLEYRSPIPLCADELIHTRTDLHKAIGKYQVINIKLDKSGGLTEGLLLAHEARAAGFGLMAGCMWGSSLAMAPATVLGQLCDFIDLDGPLLQKCDWPDAMNYTAGVLSPPRPSLWG